MDNGQITKKTALDRFDEIDQIYNSIDKNGYLTQNELENSFLIPEHHEVTINVGRDGKYIFEHGKHRFAIARALGLPSIPVRVLVRHKHWQDIRVEMNKAESKKELSEEAKLYLDHPDMKDVINFE